MSWLGALMPTFTLHWLLAAAEGSGASGTVSGVAALSVAPRSFCEPAPLLQETVQFTLRFSLAAPESTRTVIELAAGTTVSRLQIKKLAVFPPQAATKVSAWAAPMLAVTAPAASRPPTAV